MNKKKLVVLMLVLVMVLSLSVTALVGCKDKENDDINGYNQASAINLEEALGYALWNAADENSLNTLKASAQLTLTANSSTYAIKLNANLALKGGDDSNSFGLSFADVSNGGNTNILNVYYNEGYSKVYGDAYKDYDKMLFVDLGSGTEAKHFSINALSVSETLKSEGVQITDEMLADKNLDDTTIVGGVAGILNYFDIIKGMADRFDKKGKFKSSSLYQSDDGQTLLLRLKLDRILSNAKDILGVIDGYTGDLGLALTASNLGSVLPNVTIDLIFKMSGVEGGNFEGAKLEGFEAKLNVPQKDIRIQRTSEAGGGDFIRINVNKECNFGLGLDFNFGADAKNYNIAPLGFANGQNAYVNTNAINFAAKGQLTLNEKIGLSFNLAGEDMEVGIPAGTYNLKFAIDAEPTRLIGSSFDFKNNIMGSIKTILGAVDYLNIEIKNADANAEDAKNLIVTLERDERDASGVQLYAYLEDISLIGDLGEQFQEFCGKYVNIDKILDLIEPMFAPKKDDTAATTADESADSDATAAMLASIAQLIKNMTVNVNCDGNMIDIKVKNHVVNPNDSDPNNDKPDTTIDVDAVVNKTDGIKLNVVLKNMLIDNVDCGNLEASLVVKDGITITAKAPNLKLDSGKIALPIDIVLKLTNVSYGNAKTAFAA